MFYYSPYWSYWTNQKITGTAGRDWLFGGYGNDQIWSGAGADFV
jgi:Ca2+-binding RTX toxin-like protein